ncbi:uncharacterized protein LOC127879193 isoform X5 [Dreissena polymorpha]|nr:uncharacterized protein LOC127879193 isoform X3 [Dreissena polymorpha]XP_052281878.1 uncharacterized protein LOC127879193 isoform X4 [Dreissena polymorpha]XP_052281882.1 uncharacterized protein LOC127879193 isoform X5 [Dreissena polymorpha]
MKRSQVRSHERVYGADLKIEPVTSRSQGGHHIHYATATSFKDMRVLISGACSRVAYQLLPLLAAGDVFQHQGVHLVLCDTSDREDELMGVATELRDCALPSLIGVSTNADFCAACKVADVILVLPDVECFDNPGNRQLDIFWSRLSHVDFPALDGALHPVTNRQTMRSVNPRGPLSAARAIADSMRRVHAEALQNDIQMTLDPREESEFSSISVSSVSSTYPDICENHLSVTRTTEFYQKTDTLVLIASVNRKLMDCVLEKAARPKEVDTTSSLYSRL